MYYYVPALYTEVRTCWFTSVHSVCLSRSVCSIHFCPAFNSVAKRLYVLTCKSITYFLFAGVTALSFACHSPSKTRYMHICEISKYFHFAVCSSAYHNPSKRRYMHIWEISRFLHFSVCRIACHSPFKRRYMHTCEIKDTCTRTSSSLSAAARHAEFALSPASMKYWLGLNGYWPATATLAQHLTDIGSLSACTLWTHHRQQKALSSVEWLMAKAGDSGSALDRHWVELSCLLDIVW